MVYLTNRMNVNKPQSAGSDNAHNKHVQTFINVYKRLNTDKTSFWLRHLNCWFITYPTKLLVESDTNMRIFTRYLQGYKDTEQK